jgi:hypothetical protein
LAIQRGSAARTRERVDEVKIMASGGG